MRRGRVPSPSPLRGLAAGGGGGRHEASGSRHHRPRLLRDLAALPGMFLTGEAGELQRLALFHRITGKSIQICKN